MAQDPLEDVLHLEDRFYQQGYQEGLRDGAQAGRAEGRCVGMQKGFDKFFESGRLASKAVVWANRLPKNQDSTSPSSSATASSATDTMKSESFPTRPRCKLPVLASNPPRLEKNITTLYALVEPDTLSTANTDEAVQDFDDRFKRAQGKARIIERMLVQKGS